jgi:hypothetical protein
MLRTALLAASALLLGGCLSTKEPVFDASNSKPVAEIPEFMAFVDGWERFASPGESPRKLIEDGARGVVVDGVVVVQENSDYYAVAMMGQRPLMCMVYADDTMERVAAAQGVTVDIDKPEDRTLDETPVPVLADGPPEKLVGFIRDQFANQRLACIAARRGD